MHIGYKNTDYCSCDLKGVIAYKHSISNRFILHTCVDSDVHLLMLLLAGSGTAGQKRPFSLQKERKMF